jgi:hypothetical protein
MIRSLDDAVCAGEPLIDIVVIFREGVDYDRATAAVNALGSDIELSDIGTTIHDGGFVR